jgi:hypothetical protein
MEEVGRLLWGNPDKGKAGYWLGLVTGSVALRGTAWLGCSTGEKACLT